MSATVTWSFEGSPLCSWESLLGQGSVSLNDLHPLLSHWSDHQSYNNQWVDLQSSPSCSSWDLVSSLSCWIVNLICVIHALKICRMVVNVTYYDLRTYNVKSFYVGMICNVISEVCHSEVCGCVLCGLSEIVVSCFYDGCIYPGFCDLEWLLCQS